MMCGWMRRGLHYRRKTRAMIPILAVASVILILRFEFYAIEAISEQAGDFVIQESSLHAGGIPVTVTVAETAEGYFDTTRQNGDEHSEPLPSNSGGVNVNDVLDSKLEATEGIRPPCDGTQETEPRFREIGKETLIYSVWYDDRKSQHFIRMLLLDSTINPLRSLSCHFKSVSKQGKFTTVASFYRHNENHNRRYGGFIASCTVPKELDSIPCFVNISITTTAERQKEINPVSFPVGLIDRQQSTEETNGGKYGICIPPVHGVISGDRLVEFLELSQILGASHFTFYDLEMTERVRKVLNYYQNKGLVSVLAWNLPSYIGKNDVHYFGQVVSIMDCLYRSMKHLHFVAFHDLDEFIVPLRHDNITVMMKEIHKEEHCGHCFQSVIFDPSRNHSKETSPLMTQRVIERTNEATPLWTKCIVDPRRIFEQGIHHISKQNEEYFHPDKVDWNIARVFHYRNCRDSSAAMQPKCFGLEVDKTMLKFGQELMRHFKIVINATTERKP